MPRTFGRLGRHSAIFASLIATVAFPVAASAGEIVGTVSDASGTSVLQSAIVEIVELGRRATVGSDGTYRFNDVPPGKYTLRTFYTGATATETDVDVPETGAVTANLSLGASREGAILVVGQRANLASSISRQRASETIDTVLTRDAIGQFPDQNVAEALRRAPGVNILNDQGEGRFVSVRGLDPNLNSASINGNRVLAPESDVRSVALDVIPSELIESIEVKKSLTPDMDADTIGASIEINTTSAFDRKRGFVTGSLSGSYNELSNSLSPKASVDFSTRLTDDFGVSGGLSYFRRRFATDNIEMDGWNETDDGLVYADTVEYRDYDVRRERLGGSLSFDYRPSASTTLYLRGLYSRFDDVESRRRLIFEMDEAPASGSATGATFASDDGEIQVIRDIKDRQEVQQIASVSLGGRTETGPWTFSYSAAYSYADEVENGSTDPLEFARAFEEPGEFGISFDYSDPWRPLYSIGTGSSAFLDPSEYGFDKFERTTLSDSQDREIGFRADVTREFVLGSATLDLQFGGRVRLREKSYDLELDVFDGYDGDLTLADVLGRQDYDLAVIDPVPGIRPIRDFLSGGTGSFERNPIDSAFESAVADYSADEDIYAGYLLGRYDGTGLRVVGGVRMEHLKNRLRGNLVELVEAGGVHDGAELDEDQVFVTPTEFRRSYTDWFPSLNLRYEAAPDMLLRFGAYRSIIRPTMAQMAPRFLIEESDEGEREGEFGNPDLQPYRAWNFDLSAEYYFAPNAVVQAGLFYKSIGNFIVNTQVEDVTFNGVFADEAMIPINGESAKVKGLELSYQQALTFLPKPLDGLLVNFNYTYTDAEGEVDGRAIPLPASSRHTFNAVLGYEKGPLSLRLAGAYRSGYLDELGGSADEDRFVRKHFQFDASARYRLTPNIQLFTELVNGFNEPYVAYQRGPGRPNLLQYETYSWTGNFGVRANF